MQGGKEIKVSTLIVVLWVFSFPYLYHCPFSKFEGNTIIVRKVFSSALTTASKSSNMQTVKNSILPELDTWNSQRPINSQGFEIQTWKTALAF